LPILWLAYGACRFTWVNLWGNGFAREMNHALYISLVSVPMLIAALCLWLVRIPRVDGGGVPPRDET
jgi:hypothetical protein